MVANVADSTRHSLVQSNRLASGGRIERSKICVFSFNGQYLQGYTGDTLASALLANGIDTVARSFKYARARGIMTAGVEEPNAIVQLGQRRLPRHPTFVQLNNHFTMVCSAGRLMAGRL